MILSNWGFKGKPNTLGIGDDHTKKQTLKGLETTYMWIVDNETTTIQNTDFRQFLKNITKKRLDSWFIYADKPYTGTASNYKPDAWTLQDDQDLVDCLLEKGGKFMISEYDNSPFETIAQEAGLKKIFVDHKSNRLSIGKKEVIWVNYSPAFQRSIFV